MVERDLRRVAVLSEVIAARRKISSAAAMLTASVQHARRLMDRLEAGGGASLARTARGRLPNNGVDAAVPGYMIVLTTKKHVDFGPTFAAEMLVRHHGLTVS